MEVKKQRKYLVVIAILTMLAVVLSACRSGTDNTEKPDKDALKPLGKIQVIAREDGSGTRAVFARRKSRRFLSMELRRRQNR